MGHITYNDTSTGLEWAVCPLTESNGVSSLGILSSAPPFDCADKFAVFDFEGAVRAVTTLGGGWRLPTLSEWVKMKYGLRSGALSTIPTNSSRPDRCMALNGHPSASGKPGYGLAHIFGHLPEVAMTSKLALGEYNSSRWEIVEVFIFPWCTNSTQVYDYYPRGIKELIAVYPVRDKVSSADSSEWRRVQRLVSSGELTLRHMQAIERYEQARKNRGF